MGDTGTYHIRLRGQVSAEEINALAPLRMSMAPGKPGPGDPTETLFTVRADQAGVVGLLRHLHGLGFVFLAVERMEPGPSGG